MLILDNARRSIELIERTKFETIVQMFELGYVDSSLGVDMKRAITPILTAMHWKPEIINEYIEEYNIL